VGVARVETARTARYAGSARGPLVARPEALAAGSALLRLRVADAAARLLAGGDLERLKDCPGCGWFFLDRSKNGSRRWCSMAMCGGSAKARRYYRRRRGLPAE